MKSLFYWRYSLKSSSSLNAASSRTGHEGALIRVGDGFGCIHPWPELGDLPLEQQLNDLAAGNPSALGRSALDCAELDGAARREGRSLFDLAGDPMTQPTNHRLARPGDDPAEWWEKGFRSVKLKIGPDLGGVEKEIAKWNKSGFRLRLDANESISYAVFLDWWKGLEAENRESIEFVEDPIPWSQYRWWRLRILGVPLAADRDVFHRYKRADVAVYKPAVDGSSKDEAGIDSILGGWAMRKKRTIVVTSYMDHAIGQMWAAYHAACFGIAFPEPLGDCGLLTHSCFEPDSFFEQIKCDGSRLMSPGGTGLGFDVLLEELPWKRLP